MIQIIIGFIIFLKSNTHNILYLTQYFSMAMKATNGWHTLLCDANKFIKDALVITVDYRNLLIVASIERYKKLKKNIEVDGDRIHIKNL